jgi:hypothetical protein
MANKHFRMVRPLPHANDMKEKGSGTNQRIPAMVSSYLLESQPPLPTDLARFITGQRTATATAFQAPYKRNNRQNLPGLE